MELFLFLVVVISLVYRLSRRDTHQHDRRKQAVSKQAAATNEKDDFAGGSIGAYFLLEEIIDQGAGRQEPQAHQGLGQTEQFEGDCFQDDFFD